MSRELAYTVAIARFPPFTDDPLVAGVTVVKAVHITELRTRIDALRAARGLAAYSWSEPLAQQATMIRVQHITELRTALAQAYAAAGRAAPAYTDATLAAGMAVPGRPHSGTACRGGCAGVTPPHPHALRSPRRLFMAP